MDGINKKYNLEIEVLTPLSIGAGAEKDWVRGVDFVVENNKLYKLNLKKIVANGVNANELTGYFTTKNEKGLKSKLLGKLDDVSDFSMSFPTESSNDVKTFVKNQFSGNPVLVGSSLKGALRSVLFQYLGGQSNDGVEVFGKIDNGENLMRFIKLSDAEFDSTQLVNTKIYNLRGGGGSWQGGWKHSAGETNGKYTKNGFNTIYECLMPKQKSHASLLISSDLYEKIENHKNSSKERPILQGGVRALFQIINKHTRDYLNKEKRFFEKYSTDRTDEIIDSINKLLSQIPSDNSYCLIKMSAGSGFHSITGDWQFDDYTKAPLDRKREKGTKVNPKSRKIAECNGTLSLMGFVKLREITADEQKALEAERAAISKRKEEELQAQLEEAKRKAEEKALKIKQQEERRANFDRAISEVEQLVEAVKYEEAFEKLNAVKIDFPEFSQNRIDEDNLKTKISQIQAEKATRQRELEHIQARKDKAEGGLAKLLDETYEMGPNMGKYKFATFKVCAQKVESWMKAANVTQVTEGQQNALFNTIRRLHDNIDKKEAKDWGGLESKIWKQIAQFVGNETASLWYQNIKKP